MWVLPVLILAGSRNLCTQQRCKLAGCQNCASASAWMVFLSFHYSKKLIRLTYRASKSSDWCQNADSLTHHLNFIFITPIIIPPIIYKDYSHSFYNALKGEGNNYDSNNFRLKDNWTLKSTELSTDTCNTHFFKYISLQMLQSFKKNHLMPMWLIYFEVDRLISS